MARASLRTDSPKTSEYTSGSTFSSAKTARVATGSVAERSEPKSSASRGDLDERPPSFSLGRIPATVAPYKPKPITAVLITRPRVEKVKIDPKLRRKLRFLMVKPAAKMMTGSNSRLNKSAKYLGSNTGIMVVFVFDTMKRMPPITMPMTMVLLDSFKYSTLLHLLIGMSSRILPIKMNVNTRAMVISTGCDSVILWNTR
mmetsp:Transcript_12830/g.40522  ORF Transcript_12830/g.40522 Transcript_12830/m.40522 type:complete len:200 (+) Transcript_12830:1944-2543(+)